MNLADPQSSRGCDNLLKDLSDGLRLRWQDVSPYNLKRRAPHDIIRTRYRVASARRSLISGGNEEDFGAFEPAFTKDGQHRAPEQGPLSEDDERRGHSKRQDRPARQALTDLQCKADTQQKEDNATPDKYDWSNLR